MICSAEIESFLREEIRRIKLPVLVEGKRDKQVLERLGFEKVFAISGKPLVEVVDAMDKKGYREVAILTDYDEEGKEKFRLLKKLFQGKGIAVDCKLRQRIKFLFRIGKIEELKFYLK